MNKLSNFFNELLMHLGFVPLGGALFMSAVVFEWETYSRAKSLKDYMMIAVDWGFILIGCLLVINTYETTGSVLWVLMSLYFAILIAGEAFRQITLHTKIVFPAP
ncbi:MAG: hypothetical protein KBA81_08425 [Rhabdochlamydiaceae bacterium]|nr:hypothetical protein [Rhabdochlamydiaceae bacterium]